LNKYSTDNNNIDQSDIYGQSAVLHMVIFEKLSAKIKEMYTTI